jgi:predicted O-linked N-acetylglucosamine transferase (SPINDLY family)
MNIHHPDFLAALRRHAARYVAGDRPADSLAFLRQTRSHVARAWLAAGRDELPRLAAGSLSQAHAILMNCGMRNEPLSPDERRFAEKTAQPLRNGLDHDAAYNNMLACMLYLDGYETDVRINRLRVPPWLLKYVTAFFFYRAELLASTQSLERFYALYSNAFRALHSTLFDPGWTEPERVNYLTTIAIPLLQQITLVPIYFTGEHSLKEECMLRAEILEYAARTMGYATEHVFPPRDSRRKIRLGVMRPHFGPSTETFATLPIFEHLDREKFEILLYAVTKTGNNPLELYCASRADRLIDLSTQADPATAIRADDLDVLIHGTNLSGSLQYSLLALHRLARFQIASFCEPATTGMRNIDYYLAGELALPSDDPGRFYSERLLTMSGSGICFSFGETTPSVAPVTRQQIGVDNDTVMYISGANMCKFNEELCRSWARILSAVPRSVLALYPFNPNWLPNYPVAMFTREMLAIFEQHGITKERLFILEPRSDFAEIRGILNLADVYLDSYPYSGATSIADALQACLPSVTLEGKFLRFRQAAAMLREMGLSELVASREDEYQKIAINLGQENNRREKLRAVIREKLGGKRSFLDSRSYSENFANLLNALNLPGQNGSSGQGAQAGLAPR